MPKKIVLNPGDRFGDWTVVEELEPKRIPCGALKRLVSCRCKCGNVATVHLENLKSGGSSRCKECSAQVSKSANTIHGLRYHGMYGAFHAIKTRCLNPNASQYADYGGRGIRICDRWMGENGFVNFLADMGERPSPQHTIDRIDVEGDYSPDNCRWATRKEQNNNMRKNRFLTYGGKTQTLAQWSEEIGISYGALKHRLKRGWDIEKALTTPI